MFNSSALMRTVVTLMAVLITTFGFAGVVRADPPISLGESGMDQTGLCIGDYFKIESTQIQLVAGTYSYVGTTKQGNSFAATLTVELDEQNEAAKITVVSTDPLYALIVHNGGTGTETTTGAVIEMSSGKAVSNLTFCLSEPDPTNDPSPDPSDDPLPAPTDDPSPDPSDDPSPDPSDDPSPDPSDDPLPAPTDDPSPAATGDPSPDPSNDPLPAPTDDPSPAASGDPSPAATPTPALTPPPTSAAPAAGNSQPSMNLVLLLVGAIAAAWLVLRPVSLASVRQRSRDDA